MVRQISGKATIFSMLLLVSTLLLVSVPSVARESVEAESRNSSFLSKIQSNMIISLGINTWGIADNEQNHSGIVEVEFAPLANVFNIRPTLHIDIGEKDEGYYSIGASRYFRINESWSAGFGFQAGYLKNVASLGYELEFYSRLLLVYYLDVHSALRCEVGHVSNAGFGDVNPGSENLGLSYSYYF